MRKRRLNLLAAVLIAVITYTLLGSLAGSYLIEHGLRKLLTVGDEQNLEIGQILFNPFTFSAELEQLQLSEANGTSILTLDNAQLDFSIVTLLQWRIVLSEISLEKPEWSVEFATTPNNSLARLFAALQGGHDTDNGTFDVRIDHGSVHEGVVLLREHSSQHATTMDTSAPFEVMLSGVSLEIGHFQSRSGEQASLQMSATINESSTLGLSGYLIPVSGAFETNVQMANLDLARFSPLLNPNAVSGPLSGILGADGLLSRKAEDKAEDIHFTGELAIQRLEARAVPNGPPLFSANELNVSGADISAWPLRASIQFMELKQPQLEPGWQEMAGNTGNSVDLPVLSRWLSGVFGPAKGSVAGDVARNPAWPPAIDAIAITGGRVSWAGADLAKPVRIDLDHITGGITSRVVNDFTTGLRTVNLHLAGTVDESGPVTLAGMVQLASGRAGTRGGLASGSDDNYVSSINGAIGLQRVDVALLSDYFARFSARGIVSGTLNLDMGYHLEGDTVAIDSTVSLQDLLLDDREGPATGFDQPLELAIALLTDPLGEISFRLPLVERAADSAAATRTIEAALAGFITTVAASPFDLLADLAGASGMALNAVDFEPGSAAITSTAEEQLRVLGAALNKRPALGIRAKGGHARQADRTALARQQMQLHVALAASTRPSGRPEQAKLDFSDPKVQVVLDEFASERLGASDLARLKDGHNLDSEAGDSVKLTEPEAYYEEVFAALVVKEEVSGNALRQLARYRAKSVIRQLESLGVTADRLQFGGTLEADDQPVSLEVFALDRKVKPEKTKTATPTSHRISYREKPRHPHLIGFPTRPGAVLPY